MPRCSWLRTTLLAISVLAVSSTVPMLVAAQGEEMLRKNTTVRVLLPATPSQPEHFVTGHLVSLEHDTVTIAVGSGSTRPTIMWFGLDSGRKLERRVEGPGHGGRGAGIGLAVGALAGAVFGATSYQPCTGFCIMNSRGSAAASGAFLGALGGALVGFVIGSESRTSYWLPVQPAGVRVAVDPRMLGLRAEF